MSSIHPPYLIHDDFQPTDIRYGFFTRHGGVSSGFYDSLNGGFGSDDDNSLISQNRQRAAAALGFPPDQICSLYQIHSSRAIVVTKPLSEPVEADALVTKTTGLGLLILTADCVPVVFADITNGIIGAAHAGWRGAVTGILSETVKAMCDIGASRDHITAVIGPAIQQQSYQVGSDLRDAALAYDAGAETCFVPDRVDHKYRFDLTGFAAHCLNREDIRHLTINRDTYSEPDIFFSHRRATHKGEPDTGRLMTMIGLNRSVEPDSDKPIW
ncbi:MAG: peptidoglycan editing factor PgeF [Pseudomonadota bacterium]|nr:peptidoglycan editing factor PgeF [Pseudomonadota bacterium]